MLILLAWALGFGWMSRRFERQANVFGAWCAGLNAEDQGLVANPAGRFLVGAQTFVKALENVARLNGLPRASWNWRHGSIASRVLFLANWVTAGGSRESFDKSMTLLKLATWMLLIVALAATVVAWPAIGM